MCDDNRPVLTMTYPKAGVNPPLERILLGLWDYYSGIDPESLRVVADFDVDGVPAGGNLAGRFKPLTPGVQELRLSKPVSGLERGRLTVSVRDRQGNVSTIDRVFSAGR